MIVITLSKVPPKLLGDLTKWYSQIQTGVFVGNVSARVRDLLWTRILENIGSGEATMVYNAKNELGYQFKTTRGDHIVVDYDGLPLMMQVSGDGATVATGFSNAAKYRQARKFAKPKQAHEQAAGPPALVAIDLETTGTDVLHDQIISIGAAKRDADGSYTTYYQLVKTAKHIPAAITELTGITAAQLGAGVDLQEALVALTEFVGLLPIVGYNLHFDDAFIVQAQQELAMPAWPNKLIDLIPKVKKANPFIDNYRLETVLKAYDLVNAHPHNALADAEATLQLADKVIKNV